MEAAVGILKAAVFLLSAWGLGFVVYKRLKISVYFTPICTMAGVSLLLYAGGTAGYLEQTAYAVCAGGLAGCAYFVWLLIKRKIRLRAPGLFGICFGVTALVFFRLILNLKLLHYDNFSHWAVIVKYLLSSGRFPAIDTDIVVFLDYPPGSSVFIYYVCLFLGRSQGMMLLAQNSMIFACFLAVFGIVEERRRFLLYSFLGMGCAMLSYLNLTIRVNNLLVDFLLPLLAMASIAFSPSAPCHGVHRGFLSLQKPCVEIMLFQRVHTGVSGNCKKYGTDLCGIRVSLVSVDGFPLGTDAPLEKMCRGSDFFRGDGPSLCNLEVLYRDRTCRI